MSNKDRISRLFNKPEIQAGLSSAAAGASITNPVIGAFITLIKEATDIADEVRAKHIIKGLSSGLNQERYMNELENFIEASEENALFIANSLRKAILSDFLIACMLMGRIIADHASCGKPFDRCDTIIVHAVESTTDDDHRDFYLIMNKFDGGY